MRKVRESERKGLSLGEALRALMLDAAEPWMHRGDAARLLAIEDARAPVKDLLNLFWRQSEKIELRETALTFERFESAAAVPSFIEALNDSNPHRRHAAARALGWIPRAGPRAADALIRALSDLSQPQPVREEAAESFAYSDCARAIPPLVSVLDESDVRIRFWAVFALGLIGSWKNRLRPDPRVVEALERMLPDQEFPNTWWAVGREALAMLGGMDRGYRERMEEEIRRVRNDPQATREDRRWADGYGSSQTSV
jgi:HEAT repeat protein